MITEEQVLQLYNHAGLRSATSAKPRMIHLSTTGDQGITFGDFNSQKYYFVERVWFGYTTARKNIRQVDFGVVLYTRPREINIANANDVLILTPIFALDSSGANVISQSIDAYVFARQITFQSGVAAAIIAARLLIWEIEE